MRVQVVGGSNTVYYLHSDHLGSTTSLSTSAVGGGLISGSMARYYPFGAWRTAPTQTLTDRGYTGHLENMEIGLVYMNARYYVPAIGRFASADTIVPNPTDPQSLNRYSYSYNNPLKYTDPSGHCIFGVDTAVCIAIGAGILKAVDYGWTAYDTWQAGRTLANPGATRDAKLMAGLTVGLSVLFEVVEPDDILPVGLPIDDIARRGVLKGAQQALEEGGSEAFEGFLRDQLGDHADEVLGKLDELLGIADVRFHEDPGQLGHIFRNDTGHLLEDTLENRNLLLDTASWNNFVKADEFGSQWFARLLDDGTEAWVSVRNGIIQNGGVNQVPQYIVK